MASNESIFDKLNLSSGERRLGMFVLVVLLCALTWMVWGMIPDPGATQQKIDKADKNLTMTSCVSDLNGLFQVLIIIFPSNFIK